MLIARVFSICLIVVMGSVGKLRGQDLESRETVTVQSGELKLKGFLWRPEGRGPFPAVIFCHGSYGGVDTLHDPAQDMSILGPVFAGKGYVFLGLLFRRGVGLSEGQGVNSTELMEIAFKAEGQEARNNIQLEQLETDQLQDMVAGLKYLKTRRDVDINHIAVAGHSFGGSLALLLAEHDTQLKALVIFAAAGYSWDHSPKLREGLLNAVKNIRASILIIHAENDYSVRPGHTFDSLMNQLDRPHKLKIYPKFGNSANDGHDLIFLSPETWEPDVFAFLKVYMGY